MTKFSLDDKYRLEQGTVYLTGIQALVRLPIDQMRRDRRAGLKTGTFISGYEGSPLGGYDMALERAGRLLKEHNIHFVPGMNEDLAATSVLGTQIAEVVGQRNVDGILGIWYGKGPGVDRTGDAFRHANLAGTGQNSAALVLAGDDHACKSSTIPHQSDFSLYNVGIPFLYPGNVQEILDYGAYAVALSRFSGAWTGMKMVTNVCDGGGTAKVDPAQPEIRIPGGYQKKFDAHMVAPWTLMLEMEVNRARLEAAREFAWLNGLNRWFGAGGNAWLGIATAGKTFYDLMQALRDLGVERGDLERLGIRIAKFGMTFPMERRFAAEFAGGLETLLVLEEKRSFLELQLRDVLYNLAARPAIIGKEDEQGRPLVPPAGELDPDTLAKLLAARLAAKAPLDSARQRVTFLESIGMRTGAAAPPRRPNYCSGCPHNRSTLLMEGQVAGGGIGCHGMGIMLGESNRGYMFCTQMGGEGAPWIGMSRFLERKHIFQNMGDGTFAHSGQLAINACIAAGVNITFKILYNDAVAMTGGQHAQGALPIPDLTRKLEAEGVKKIFVLAEDLSKYADVELAGTATLKDREELPAVLRELEETPGVTAMIYDQRCAAEKRRLRSRGKLEEPTKRLVIHEEVCEGCGDCVKQSNCMSLYPVQTDLGQKIRIHQSSCNKDYSCALGDCPSFVTVNIKAGTGLKKRKLGALPELGGTAGESACPTPAKIVEIGPGGYRIVGPGIGGTGVVTVNALLATAAVLDGLNVMTLDQTGLAQKGGAVVSHLLLGREPLEAANKTNAGNADLILGFDLIGAASTENLKTAHPERTVAIVNTAETPTGDSIRARKVLEGPGRLVDLINASTRRGHNVFLDANRLAESLFGTHMAVNLFMLGTAWQAGLVPLSLEALREAIRLNGVEVDRNLQILAWGRQYYHDAAWVENQAGGAAAKPEKQEDIVEHRYGKLIEYQNKAYADEFAAFVRKVADQQPALRDTVARYLYKLMAIKDEYECARLLTSAQFERQVQQQWEAVESIEYNLHPPLLRRFGIHKKLHLGDWFRPALSVLATLKGIRGTAIDLFGYAALRRAERGQIAWYRELIEQLLPKVTAENLPQALEIAALPDQIRGYENIRRDSMKMVEKLAAEKLAALGSNAKVVAQAG